ncbi:MAG TPA: thioesterase family protein [Acidimicrobiales bacterium]
MGDIAEQTAVVAGGDPESDGRQRFSAELSAEWEIWGPEGGYVAAVALRAAGAASPFARPASFFCHFLSVAAFEPVELVVTPRRAGRTVLAQRVEMSQHGRPVLDAMVWSVGDVHGLEHEDISPPQVADPDDLKSWAELREDDHPQYAFWHNFDQKPIDPILQWPPPEPLPPTFQAWLRAQPRATFADPWEDAARTLIMLDVMSWPAGSRPHAHKEHGYIAPALDLYTAFHHAGSNSEWVLLDGHSPVAAEGLLAWNGRLWSLDRTLLASGGGQAVFRHT